MNSFASFAAIQLLVVFVASLGIMFGAFNLLRWRIVKRYGLAEDNFAFALFGSGVLLSIAYLLSGITTPLIATIKMLESSNPDSGQLFLEAGKYASLYLSIGLVVVAIIIVLSVLLYTSITHLNEFTELKKDNRAVGLLTAVIIFSISLLVRQSMIFLIEAFVPYPDMPNLY